MLHCEELKELKDDELPSNTLEHFTELNEILDMIDNIKPYDANGFEKDYEQFTEILSRYQEQPHLLDPHLEQLLQRLLFVKIRKENATDSEMHAAFKYLYIISKVRTYKVLVKFLPHELSDLEFALELLEAQNQQQFSNWETRYMLLLWLSILVLNPFHMSRLDAYEAPTAAIDVGVGTSAGAATLQMSNHIQPTKITKMERIYELIKLYTATNDTCSKIAAFLAAKYLVRADIKDIYLVKFFDWIMGTADVKFGQLAALAAILKHGKREDLLPYADKLLSWVQSLNYQDSNDFLKYKYYIKIMQRIGLIYLKPRIASWRYKRGTRSLATNLNQATSSGANSTAGDENNIEDEAEFNVDEEAYGFIVPDAIEEVIDQLLEGLRSGGNEIRHSAAKGIGRITGRLSKPLGDEVIGSVIDILNPLEGHTAWHGACLALAELAKRGLLLPYRLTLLIPLLLKALFYDQMRGYMSVGQDIRDAACYICWAFARAYNPEDLQPFVKNISAGLLTVAVFDREINCRRAASAAFQESVGRLGNFPHGIDISTSIDFYSVGLRQNSYLNLSDNIAQYEEYREPLIFHLLQYKVSHWDTAIRELTAKALHKLTFRAPEFMAEEVIATLFEYTDSSEINGKHGSVLAAGEVLLALRQIEQDKGVKLISDKIYERINDLMASFLRRDLFRGMSGEILKQSCTSFIRNCSLGKIDVDTTVLDHWQQIIDKCLLNKTVPIREAATVAFADLCNAYYNVSGRSCENIEIVNAFLVGAAAETEEHIRMGYISALGVLPKFMIMPLLDEILDALIKHSLTTHESYVVGDIVGDQELHGTSRWSEARRDSIKALNNLVQTIGFDNNNNNDDVGVGVGNETKVTFAEPKYFNKIIECYLRAMNEYTLDNRGDIGAWVREAAMTAVYQLLTTCPKHLLQPTHIHQIMLGFVQQSVEKIDRTRGLAGRLCCNIINAQPVIPYIREHERLKVIFPEDTNSVLWLFADHTFPLFVQLLEIPDYSKRLLLGLSASIGQLTESLIKHSSTALFQYLRTHQNDVARLCKEIVENFEEHLYNERITYPTLNFLDILIGSGTIGAVLHDETATFSEDIYRLLNQETKGTKKLYKLSSAINVYCQLVQVSRLCKRILSKLSVFLGLSLVHVRKTTATKLYEVLALHGENCEIPQDNIDDILNILSETDWSLTLNEVRPVRNQLCGLLDIKAPVSGASAGAGIVGLNATN